ncbi:MAG: hypothetical protein ACREEA_06225, partial [Stellaceae bacterium]
MISNKERKMNFRSLCVIAAMLFLAACQSSPQSGANAGGTAASASAAAPGSREDFVQNVGD